MHSRVAHQNPAGLRRSSCFGLIVIAAFIFLSGGEEIDCQKQKRMQKYMYFHSDYDIDSYIYYYYY